MLCSTLVALLFRANNAVTSPTPTTPSAVLDAGAGRSAWLSPDTGSVEVVLSGAFYPLGKPERSPLRVAWSLVLGPTAPVFSDATAGLIFGRDGGGNLLVLVDLGVYGSGHRGLLAGGAVGC